MIRFAPIVVITGTDTGVGKTIATAAIAAALIAAGRSVAIDKPTQTGVLPDEPGDVDEVTRLTGITATTEGVRLAAAMAPVAAAAAEARMLPTLEEHAARIHSLSGRYDHVLVEGAGGLLVHLTPTGQTIAELARLLTPTPDLVVVTRAGLGTLNNTQLTLEAIAHRDLTATGVIIGDWPTSPDAIDRSNRAHFDTIGTPLLGAIPHRASQLSSQAFRAQAPGWLSRPR